MRTDGTQCSTKFCITTTNSTFFICYSYAPLKKFEHDVFIQNSVLVRHRFDADPDLDPNFHFDADQDPDWDQNDADPHADPTKFYTCQKIRKTFFYFYLQ